MRDLTTAGGVISFIAAGVAMAAIVGKIHRTFSVPRLVDSNRRASLYLRRDWYLQRNQRFANQRLAPAWFNERERLFHFRRVFRRFTGGS